MKSRALIAGATGLIGSNLAEHLLSKGWEVYGVSRSPEGGIPGVRPVAVDMLNPEALRVALAGIDTTHVFLDSAIIGRIGVLHRQDLFVELLTVHSRAGDPESRAGFRGHSLKVVVAVHAVKSSRCCGSTSWQCPGAIPTSRH
jgi:NAD(P)-dependent dehydrogenase (short-subunit alcohol dehydrogenase family)